MAEHDHLLADLNDEQRLAVTSTQAPLAILAGAGSGKTRVLTRRVAWRAATDQIDPRRTLVLTFTRKAAGELTDRLRALGLRDSVAAGTFHAVAYAQLRQRWADQGRKPPELLDRKVGLVARALGSRHASSALEVVGEIEWAKARLVAPDRYVAAATAAARRPQLGAETISSAYHAYEELKSRQRLVDFDDLLGLCRHAIDTDTEFARAQRWRLRHFFVDEFQDVNSLQYALLRAWLGDRPDLCVVGDPNQAIYGWNGADADFLDQFDRWFPGGATVRLRRNHRSTPQVLHAAAAILRSGAALATVPDGPLPTVRMFDDEWAEARGIARAIRDAHPPGSRWSDQGVLVRTNAQVAVIEEILRGAGIPCRTRAGSGLLDRPEVAAILKRWRRADHVTLSTALAEMDRSFPGLAARSPTASEFEPDPYGPEPEDESGPESGDDSETRASVAALARIGRDHLALDPECSAARFARWLQAARSSGLDDPAADMVDLATFHAAKGLEWKVVHLAGIEEGFVPISHARSAADRAEEQRLLYVAITRAERDLSISWARSRSLGARSRTREPSPWLDQINLAIAELRRLGRPAGGSEAVAQLRQRLHESSRSREGTTRSRGAATSAAELSPADSELRESIRRWRHTTAKAADVPAYAVFADVTLDALVATKPQDEQSLLDITGLGPAKVTRYGADLLSLLAAGAAPPARAQARSTTTGA